MPGRHQATVETVPSLKRGARNPDEAPPVLHMGGGPSLMYAADALAAYEQFLVKKTGAA